MSDVKYSKEHEWIKLEGDIATIGITKHATEMLGDIVFTELPEKGTSVEKDGTAGVVESTKAASDVYTPVSGEVVDTNQSIVDDPSKINQDPENSAWFFKLKIKDKSLVWNTDLLESLEYKNLIAQAVVTMNSAHNRKESRGAHAREDFKERDDKNWMKHTLSWLDDEKCKLEYRSVHEYTLSNEVKYIEPKARVY